MRILDYKIFTAGSTVNRRSLSYRTTLNFTNGHVLLNTDWLGLFQYMDGENKSADAGNYSCYVASLGLYHHLSARTMLYAVGSYAAGNDLLERSRRTSV